MGVGPAPGTSGFARPASAPRRLGFRLDRRPPRQDRRVHAAARKAQASFGLAPAARVARPVWPERWSPAAGGCAIAWGHRTRCGELRLLRLDLLDPCHFLHRSRDLQRRRRLGRLVTFLDQQCLVAAADGVDRRFPFEGIDRAGDRRDRKPAVGDIAVGDPGAIAGAAYGASEPFAFASLVAFAGFDPRHQSADTRRRPVVQIGRQRSFSRLPVARLDGGNRDGDLSPRCCPA